jgi:hypothetical protein
MIKGDAKTTDSDEAGVHEMNGPGWSGGTGDTGNTADWITMTDPNEGAFSVQMPRGWQNQAFQVRPYDQVRSVVNSRSPDGSVYLFLGDPNLPTFMDPSQMYGGMMPFGNPLSQVHPYIPADAFFSQYAQQRFGQSPGFQINSAGPNPMLERAAHEKARQRGMNVWVTSISISFQFSDNGTPVNGLLHGLNISFGNIWVPDVSGILTTGDPAQYNEMLMHMSASYQTSAQWRQQQDNLHAQRMNQINANHQSAMASMQAGHAARMDAIQQFGAANTQMWQERQSQNDAMHQSFIDSIRQTPASVYDSGASGSPGYTDYSDASHQRFLNTIKEENTVVDQSGQTYQVESGHERYYINKRDNSYIGTDSTTDQHHLRAKFGVNPDDYEEVKIKR